ncbi:MAG: glycosyltransferase family 2 protein [Candidatus Muiribacteriota bacterium]
MFFSVIIPVFNRYEDLIESIKSVLNQSFQDFELLVLDDGSDQEIADFLKLKKIHSSKLKLLKNHKNMGIPFTRNKLIKNTKGDYILTLGSDDVLEKDALKNYYLSINKNLDYYIYYGNCCRKQYDEKRNETKVSLINIPDFKDEISSKYFVFGNFLPDSGTVIKKSFYSVYGYYNEKMTRMCDYELWSRVCYEKRMFCKFDFKVAIFRLFGDNITKNIKLISLREIPINNILAHKEIDIFPYLFDDYQKFNLLGDIFRKYKLNEKAQFFYKKALNFNNSNIWSNIQIRNGKIQSKVKKIYIYGTGEKAKEAESKLSQFFIIEGFIDVNNNNDCFLSKKICSLDKMPEKSMIIVASSFWQFICLRLIRNLKKFELIIY